VTTWDGFADDSRETLSAAVEAGRAATEVAKGGRTDRERRRTAIVRRRRGANGRAAAGELPRAIAGRCTGRSPSSRTSFAAARRHPKRRRQIGSSAEELSATIQELSGAASEVMAAIEQINRSCQVQAAATEQTSAGLAQIEKSAKLAQANGKAADERIAR
jgi:methyl-accepting chemotaxis protein